MPGLHRLFYVSRALIDPCGPEPRDILDVARARNAASQITGLLSYSGDHFAQVLEGPDTALNEVMASIRRDARHQILLEWPIEQVDDDRWFPGWRLAYLFDERLEDMIARLLALPETLPPYALLVRGLQAAASPIAVAANDQKGP